MRTELFGVHLRHLADRTGEEVCEPAGARLDESAHGFAPVMREPDDVMADIFAAHAGRVGCRNERAKRGAGDRCGFYAQLIERLDDCDMGKAARATTAERERKGLHAPA